ncbi:unnamed protein product, partial [Ilex paraguariensis]
MAEPKGMPSYVGEGGARGGDLGDAKQGLSLGNNTDPADDNAILLDSVGDAPCISREDPNDAGKLGSGAGARGGDLGDAKQGLSLGDNTDPADDNAILLDNVGDAPCISREDPNDAGKLGSGAPSAKGTNDTFPASTAPKLHVEALATPWGEESLETAPIAWNLSGNALGGWRILVENQAAPPDDLGY